VLFRSRADGDAAVEGGEGPPKQRRVEEESGEQAKDSAGQSQEPTKPNDSAGLKEPSAVEGQQQGRDVALEFAVGAWVEIRGLSGAKELNGLQGELWEFIREKGRWCVEVGDLGRKSIKPENLVMTRPAKDPSELLREGEWVRICGLDTGNALNGLHCRVNYEVEPGRWNVNVEGLGAKVLDAKFFGRPSHSGPQSRTCGQFHRVAGMDGDFRPADFEALPKMGGID